MSVVTDNEEDYEEEVWWENEMPDVFSYTCTDDDAPDLPEENETSISSANTTFSYKLLNWLLIFLMRLQAKHYLSDAAILSILKFTCAGLINYRQTEWFKFIRQFSVFKIFIT